MDQQTNELIKSEIENNEVCLFMKGTPDAPQCGFSMAISNILKILEVNFNGVNVSMEGKAVENGHFHQLIKVTNLSSGKIIQGRIINQKNILIK